MDSVVDNEVDLDVLTEDVQQRESEHVLEFFNPVLLPGLNVTVRNGLKWLKAAPGDKLLIKKTGEDKVLQTGYALNAVGMSDAEGGELVDFIPEYWLKFEHDPACRTIAGLKEAMNRAYGEGKWGTELVILFFIVE